MISVRAHSIRSRMPSAWSTCSDWSGRKSCYPSMLSPPLQQARAEPGGDRRKRWKAEPEDPNSLTFADWRRREWTAAQTMPSHCELQHSLLACRLTLLYCSFCQYLSMSPGGVPKTHGTAIFERLQNLLSPRKLSRGIMESPAYVCLSVCLSVTQGSFPVRKRTGTLRIWRARERERIWKSGAFVTLI